LRRGLPFPLPALLDHEHMTSTSPGPAAGPRVAVVIPAFNEAEVIGAVIDQLLPLGYHVVVVNDGSRDRTAEVAARRDVVVVSHPINRGRERRCRPASRWHSRWVPT
jgi:cellulose synthase/poly-beta-1,6-N-acetylglucosamine synthase-like glycosyltransferase